MRRTVIAALCLAAAASTTLTACQSGKDSADDSSKSTGATSAATPAEQKEPFAGLSGGEILDQARTATTGASSLRLTGDVPDEETGDTITVDMALNKQGECAGTLTMNGQGKTELIRTGDTVYMRYDEAFLRAQNEGDSPEETTAIVEAIADKWTKTAATGEDALDISAFCDLDALLEDTDEGRSDATRGETTTVDGTPAVTVMEKDGKNTYTVYVATEGEPYLLRVDSTSAEGPETLTFSDYGKPVPAQKPSGEIIDLDALAG